MLALMPAMNPATAHPLHLSPIVAGLWRLSEWGLDAAGLQRWVEQALDLGLRPMIWSPLGRGRLFGAADEQVRRVHAVLSDLGQARGVSVATMAFAWILRHPAKPWPITGTGRLSALQEAVAALDVNLSAEDWYRVWEASMGHPVP